MLARLVLNAFRHQRNNRTAAARSSVTIYLCSTPSGIKGTIAYGSMLSLAPRNVLNAFRHQRNNRYPVLISGTHNRGAQRLPASKEQSQGRMTLLLFTILCSTPSGIKGTIAIAGCSGRGVW